MSIYVYFLSDRCVTVDGPGRGKECQFPFIFEDKTRTGCTTDTDPEGKPWCSTKVDSQGVHVGGGGHWAHCSPDCPVDEKCTSG